MIGFQYLVLLILALPIMLPSLAIASYKISTPFYRWPQGNFASGYTDQEVLFNQILEKKRYVKIDLIKDNKKISVDRWQVLTDLDLSSTVFDSSKKIKGTLVERTDLDYRVIIDHAPNVIEYNKLESWPKDLGKIIPWKPTPFLTDKYELSKTRPWAKAGQPFKVLKFLNQYAVVMSLTSPYEKGYLYVYDCISKIDFATHVLVFNQWTKIHRTTNGLFSTNGTPIHLHQIQALQTDKQTAVLIDEANIDKKLNFSVRSKFIIQNYTFEIWNKSYLAKHGLIWWQEHNPNTKHLKPIDQEFFKNKTFSKVIDPNSPNVQIVSADGIFISRDGGQSFLEIPQFRGQNWPVSIGSDGTLFAGYFSANPNTLDFLPYIKPQDFIKFFDLSNLKKLKLVSINPLKNKRLHLTVTNEKKTIQIYGNLSSSNIKAQWKVW